MPQSKRQEQQRVRQEEVNFQPTRACKTRFTIKAKVVDNDDRIETLNDVGRDSGRSRQREGEPMVAPSGVAP